MDLSHLLDFSDRSEKRRLNRRYRKSIMDLLIKCWDEIVGIIFIVVGLLWIAKKFIHIGIEDREALFYIKGRLTALFGFFMVIVGLLFILDIIKIN